MSDQSLPTAAELRHAIREDIDRLRAALADLTRERDNAVKTAQEMSAEVLQLNAALAERGIALVEALEALNGGWPEAPEIQPASWVISAADFMDAVMRGDMSVTTDDPDSVYEAARELRTFATTARAALARIDALKGAPE